MAVATRQQLVSGRAVNELGKTKTGIEGFDEILGGGVPRGSVTLVTGAPGTMKSTLAYAILHNNALAEGTPSLYISLEQAKASLHEQMAAAGLDLAKTWDRVHILDVGAIQKRIGRSRKSIWVNYLKRAVDVTRRIAGSEILVLDSLEALEVLAKFEDRRSELFDFFEWLRGLGITAFIIAEGSRDTPAFVIDGGQRTHNDEQFLADGVIEIQMHPINELDVQRRLRVVKMRTCNHKTGFYTLVFDDRRFSVTRSMSV
jgi:circadian clock protein KaiC